MIDASIPLRAAQGAQVNLADLLQQQQQMKMQERQMQMQQERIDFDRELQGYKLDAKKAEALKEGVKDMHAAVRWADTPEKWAQVQQHYGRMDPQIASIPYEQRESALMQLGQLDQYLEANKEKFQSIEAGGSLYGIKPDGTVREVVRANPGDQQFGTPAAGNMEGRTATNPQTGEKLIYRGGQWVPAGGGAGNSVGGFPPR